MAAWHKIAVVCFKCIFFSVDWYGVTVSNGCSQLWVTLRVCVCYNIVCFSLTSDSSVLQISGYLWCGKIQSILRIKEVTSVFPFHFVMKDIINTACCLITHWISHTQTMGNTALVHCAFSICITMITKNTFIYEAFRPSKALWVNRILLLALETFSRQQWLMYFRLRCLEQLTEVTLCWWMWHRNPHACAILSWESFYMCFILLIGTYILIAIKMIKARTFRTGCATIFHVLQFVQGKKKWHWY